VDSHQQTAVIEAGESEFSQLKANECFPLFSVLCSFANGGLLGTRSMRCSTSCIPAIVTRNRATANTW